MRSLLIATLAVSALGASVPQGFHNLARDGSPSANPTTTPAAAPAPIAADAGTLMMVTVSGTAQPELLVPAPTSSATSTTSSPAAESTASPPAVEEGHGVGKVAIGLAITFAVVLAVGALCLCNRGASGRRLASERVARSLVDPEPMRTARDGGIIWPDLDKPQNIYSADAWAKQVHRKVQYQNPMY